MAVRLGANTLCISTIKPFIMLIAISAEVMALINIDSLATLDNSGAVKESSEVNIDIVYPIPAKKEITTISDG